MWSFSSKHPTDNLYSLLKLPLWGYEPKRAVFECIALIQMSCCSRRSGRSFKSLSFGISSRTLWLNSGSEVLRSHCQCISMFTHWHEQELKGLLRGWQTAVLRQHFRQGPSHYYGVLHCSCTDDNLKSSGVLRGRDLSCCLVLLDQTNPG